jgi:hypothetical protein
MNAPVKKRLGELLVDAGIIDETQLKAALGHQRQWGVRLGQALVDLKLATEQEIVRVLAKRFGFEVARLDQVEAYAHQQAVGLVPREFAVKHNVFPLGADTSTLSIAMSDPSNLAVIDELRFRSGRRVKVSIGGDREIAAAVQAAYPSHDGAVEAIALDIDDGMDPGEPVMASFGGGSSADFDSFFGAEPSHPAEADPFGAEPAAAPVAVPASQPSALTGAPVPTSMPAAFAALAAPAPAPRPTPAPTAPRPAARAAAPTAPAMRAAPATPAPRAAPVPAARAPAPAQPRAAPAAGPAQARPAPRPAISELELELPSSDAVRDARALRGPSAPPAPVMPAELALHEPEELTPLSEDVEFTGSLPIAATAPSADGPGAGAAGVAATPAEQAILTALRRLADGGRAEPEVLKPTQLMAALAQLLLQKGLVTERELLDALGTPGED